MVNFLLQNQSFRYIVIVFEVSKINYVQKLKVLLSSIIIICILQIKFQFQKV